MSSVDPGHVAAVGQSNIVVWDPTGEFWEGSLIDSARARQLVQRGVAVLPCVPEMFHASGVGGYAKRAWGAGWPLDSAVPRLIAPLTLFCDRSMKGIHWAIRLVTSPEYAERVRGGDRFSGMIRFAADRSQQTPFFTGVSGEKGVLAEEIGPPDEQNGWTLQSSGVVNVPQNGHYGFGVYGTAPGLRVAWVAASLTVT